MALIPRLCWEKCEGSNQSDTNIPNFVLIMNFVDLFEEHGVEFKQHGEHHHSTKNWLSIDCPQCSPNSHRFRAAFHLSQGSFNCWSCGKSNPVIMLADLLRVPRPKAYDLLRRVLPAYADDTRETQDHNGIYTPPAGVLGLLEQHVTYLRSRGFDPEEIVKIWGVSGLGIHSKLPWRLFIPIHDKVGKPVSWTTRSLSDKAESRYISAQPQEEKIQHKSILYGHHLIRNSMMICEGPLDVWAIGPGAAATFGVSYSESQLALMTSVPVRVVCFDSEPLAQRRAEKLCRCLASFPGQTENIILETGKDPASADKAEIQQLRQAFLE